MTRLAWLAAGSVAAGAGTLLAGIGLMTASGYLISRASARPPILDLVLVFVAVRFFGLARPALRYVERLASHELTFRLLLVVRRWFFAALLPLSPAQLSGFRAGDLLSRVAADVDAIQEAYLRVAAPVVVAIVVSIVTMGGFAAVDGRLAALVGALLVVHGGVWSWFAQRQSADGGARRNAERRALSADLVSLLQGREDVLAFGYEGAALDRFTVRQRRLDDVERLDGARLALHAAVGSFITACAAWGVLATSLVLLDDGRLSAVWLAPLMLAAAAAFESVEALPAAWQFAGQTADSARRVLDVVQMRPAVVQAAACVRLAEGAAHEVAFENVCFGYGAAAVVSNLSFTVASGEHVALVGPTGVGKSTVMALLTRGWDPQAGRITLDGIDLRDVALDDLPAHIAVLPQEVHVFNDTLRENVRLAKPDAPDEAVEGALRSAALGSFLDAQPDGLGTMLGEQGARMSAGERQRLGFARIVLSEARLVLADEPTAHLDGARERQLLDSLHHWARGRTLILASHRAAALAIVSRTLVLGPGGECQGEGCLRDQALEIRLGTSS